LGCTSTWISAWKTWLGADLLAAKELVDGLRLLGSCEFTAPLGCGGAARAERLHGRLLDRMAFEAWLRALTTA
jgi:hypothetical protein